MPLAPVKVWQFAVATFVGSIPSSILAVEAGAAIARLEAGEEVLRPSPKHVAILLTLTVFAILPYLLKKFKSTADLSDFKKIQSAERLVARDPR